jgi:hypothetical protein
MSEPALHIRTGREDRKISGMDTLIATMPQGFYAEFGVPGERALKIQQFGEWLRKLAESQAKNLGEELHHADFVITTSPTTVQARGAMHDCEKCRAGVRSALRVLRENPERELLVGALYWAGPPQPKGEPS